jgi:hypothetical protein
MKRDGADAAIEVRRKAILRPGAVAALIAAAVLAASFAWTPEGLPDVSVCWVKRTLGVPCPGCGMTRAFCAISHGRFAQATRLNPLSWIFYAGAVGVMFMPFVPRRPLPPVPFGWVVAAAAALIVLMFGCWAARLFLGLI